MLAAVRLEKIKELLLQNKVIKVSEISKELGVSEETIRRDFTELEKEGVLTKIHGGALLASKVQSAVKNSTLKGIFKENKEIIANRAEKFVQTGDVVFLDSTTTSLQIAEKLSSYGITVITNSVEIMYYLRDFNNINLLGVGGEYLSINDSFIGKDALETIKNYNIDKAFVSPRSLDTEKGITHMNQNTAYFLQQVLKQARVKIIAADHSKFNKVSLVKFDDFNLVDCVITDKKVPKVWQAFFEERQIAVVDTDGIGLEILDL